MIPSRVQGKADVVDVKGAGNFAVRLFVNDETHLPIMISWQTPLAPNNIILLPQGQAAPATLQPGAVVVPVPAQPAATASQEDKDKYAKDVAGKVRSVTFRAVKA